MEIKITINGLDQLTEALALIGSALALQKGMVNTAEAAVNLMNEVTGAADSVTEEPKEDKKVVTEEGPPPITLEQVRAKLADLSRAGKAAEAKGILTDLGFEKLTEVPQELFPEVLKKAEAI